MEIAVGLPSRPALGQPYDVPGWARSVERGPFSSLTVGDRVVAPAHEALTLLAVASGATTRIRLMASLIVAPARETTLLARQAASLDAASGGRLVLGLGVGIREDDYRATGMAFDTRGDRFEEQLGTLRRLWDGEALDETVGPIGIAPARPGGPELLIGGYRPAVARRIARWGDGFMVPGGGHPDQMRALWERIQEAWSAAGRTGQPRQVAGTYFALGPGAAHAAATYIETYYGYDPVVAERRRRDLPTTVAQVRARIRRHADEGADELILRPVLADPAMVDRLADLLG